MRFPAYVFLPILGAVVLAVAVLGSWLWPASTEPLPSRESPVVAMPADPEPPARAPAPLPPPARPMNRPMATRTAPAVPPPPGASPGPMPSEPVAGVPSPPMAPPGSQPTEMSPEAKADIRQKWASLRSRAADLATRALEQSERQRDEARARGDQAEFERLDAIARKQREQVEMMRRTGPGVPSSNPGVAPPAQSGPPVE